MTLDEVNELVTRVKKENREVEFKTTTAEMHKVCRTLCAFLNGRGGVVLIGVKNNGQPIGQMVTDPTCQEIANDIRKIEPPVQVDVSYIPLGEKFVISLEVPAGDHMPYVFDGRPYHRVENETVVMPQHLYEQLIVKRGQLNHAWDEYTNNEYTIDDLDHDEIRKAMKKGVLAKRIPESALQDDIYTNLKRLKLLEDDRLKNAAIVLFAKEMDSDFSQCMIKMARFKGESKSNNFIDNQQIYGNAFKIFNEASNFMEKHLNIASFMQEGSFARVDKFTVPVLAAREAIINSVCHRQYQNTSAISLAIFNDKMEIWNSGILPRELSLEDLKAKHESHPRNKLIARTLYKLGFIERWGNGTVAMLDECRKHGIPDPIFEEYSSGLSVQFIFEEPIGPILSTEKRKQENNKVHLLENLSKRQREIIDVIGELKEAKASEIKEKLSEDIPERTLRFDLGMLKKQGLIVSRGVTKNTTWYLKK